MPRGYRHPAGCEPSRTLVSRDKQALTGHPFRGPMDHGIEVDIDLDVLDEIQRRVLWLAVRIVDAANRERDTGDGVKVGGHQASSASLASVVAALWLDNIE